MKYKDRQNCKRDERILIFFKGLRRTFDREIIRVIEYFITDLGQSLMPIIGSMKKWGEENMVSFS